MTEQAAGASQIVQAVDAMRKGAASTTRSIAEQSTALEQVAKETDKLTGQYSGLAKSMAEQAKNCQEITAAASDLEQQTAEATRAMKEQARQFKGITGYSSNVSKQIKLITAANMENSKSTTDVLEKIKAARELAGKNGEETHALWRILGASVETKSAVGRRTARPGAKSSALKNGGTP